MRDYIVVWVRTDFPSNKHRWYADDPGGQNAPDPSPVYNGTKIFTRMPNQQMILDCFNRSADNPLDNYMQVTGTRYSFADGWKQLFGGDTEGGYLDLNDVPTSDAFGALHGRPARAPDGKFIVNPY